MPPFKGICNCSGLADFSTCGEGSCFQESIRRASKGGDDNERPSRNSFCDNRAGALDGGRVFVAPTDAERVYGLDGETGQELWESGPTEGAQILGVANRLGSLEAGKDADVIVLDGPPLSMKTWVESVYIGGELVYSRAAGAVLAGQPR